MAESDNDDGGVEVINELELGRYQTNQCLFNYMLNSIVLELKFYCRQIQKRSIILYIGPQNTCA